MSKAGLNKNKIVFFTRLGLTLLCGGLLVWFFYQIRGVFTPFLYGFILAYLLNPLVDALEARGLKRGLAITLVYLFLGVGISGLVVYALPALLRDLNLIVEAIPEYTKIVQQTVQDIQLGYRQVPIPDGIRQISDEMIREGEAMALGIVQGFARGVLGFFSQAFNLVLAPILSFYFLLEFNRIGRVFLELVPVRYRPELTQIGSEINVVIKRFIRGNLLVAFLVGLMAVIGMTLIGMDFPLLIGIVVGLTNFIPYFGAFISALPAVLIASLKSKWLAVYVIGLMLVIQQIEGNIISPKILGNSVGLHPLLIIFALMEAGQVWGVVGLLVAVPAAAILKILLKHLYRHLV